MKYPILFTLTLLLLGPAAHATEDGPRILGPGDDQVHGPGASLLPPEERYSRANEVFAHYGLPAEAPERGALEPYELAQTAGASAKILATLDPTHQFPSWFTADASGLTGFLDGGARRVTDFRVAFAATEEGVRPTGLLERLRRAARDNPSTAPLRGLTVALDPGHMGTDLWDTRTGKFVKDAAGNKISEALINLQTCLLAEQGLEALGATVVLTHRDLSPVYAVPYEKLSIDEWARRELRGEALAPWFQSLLASGTGEKLTSAFEKSAQVKKLFAEFQRINYFMLRADLEARVNAIRAARPDLTLIVHYDTAGGTAHVDPKAVDGTKTYVVGDYEPGEFATQKQRTQLARKLVDREGWEASLLLSRLVVRELQHGLAIPFSKSGGGTSFELEPGVFARNLGIPSGLDGQAVTYVETLAYDAPAEFRQLRDFKHSMKIGGVDYPYSDRLAAAAGAIVKGVRAFVASYAAD